MSNVCKQDVLTKTIEDERIQIGVLKASVDETEEPSLSEDEEEPEEASSESEKSGDTNVLILTAAMLEFYSEML